MELGAGNKLPKKETILSKTGIMTDSHSGILEQEAREKKIHVLPMPFIMNGTTYYEGVSMTRSAFYEKLREDVDVATSQPSPQDVMEMWDEMLKEYDEIVYIPISSGLSGSCMTAQALAQDEPYEGRVFVVDNGRCSTPMHQSVLDAIRMVEAGYHAEQIKARLEETKEQMIIYIGLSTLEYLKKGGRIKAGVATIANVLNIKPVMKFGTGTLDIYQKCRGIKNARKAMIEAMKTELETNFKKAYDAGKVHLLAASSCIAEVTEDWVKQIKESFPGMEVRCDELSCGLACHIGPDGLGIGCSTDPM